MPVRQQEVDAILNRLSDCLDHHVEQGEKLVSVALAVESFGFSSLPKLAGDWFYWNRPQQQDCLLGLGEALRLSATGPTRLDHLAERHQQWCSHWRLHDPDGLNPPLTCFSGFAFNANDLMDGAWQGWPNAAIFFPELLLQQQAGHALLLFTTLASKKEAALRRWTLLLTQLAEALRTPVRQTLGSTVLNRTMTQPSDQEWTEQINQATKLIRGGKLHKVVPFRRISIQAPCPLEPAQLMAYLNAEYGSSIHFSTRLRDLTFASVTPERLLSCHGDTIRCDAIGGTIRRDSDPEQDAQLANTLLNDPKCLHEHALVVKNIQQTLSPLCRELDYPATPALRKLPRLQHLWSEFSGTLKQSMPLLKICDLLHPTAAVNGFPSADAGIWLNQHAPTQRGWYSGAAGWLDSQGNGEMAVLLRCALLKGDSADLFAGAGITDASSADLELMETELKFNTMLQALQHAAG